MRRELPAEFPTPTSSLGWSRLWWWSLPGRTITGLSILTGLAVFGLCQATAAQRGVFVLPGPIALYGFGAALAAGVVALAGRRRPGRVAPRLWPPVLVLFATALALAAVSPGHRFDPALNAGVAATTGAALVLLFRLARPVLSGRRVEWVVGGAFTAAGVALLGLVPLTMAARGFWGAELAEALGSLRRVTLHAPAAGKDAAALERLTEIRPESLYRVELWRAAAALGWRTELTEQWRAAIEAAAQGLEPDQGPNLASYPGTAVWWDRSERVWQADPAFEELSQRIGRRQAELGRLFVALDPRRVQEVGGPNELRTVYLELSAAQEQQRRARVSNWLDGWQVARLPGGDELFRQQTLATALHRRTLVSARGHDFQAAELWNLMVLGAHETAALEHQPGCRRFEYDEEGSSYLRFDCYAYRPAADSLGAEMWFEIRLVYRAALVPWSRTTVRWGSPQEVYFLSPVPAQVAESDYQEQVMAELATAVERSLPGLSRRSDRSGTSAEGFRLDDGRQRLSVQPSTIAWYGGRRAIQVRATWVP